MVETTASAVRSAQRSPAKTTAARAKTASAMAISSGRSVARGDVVQQRAVDGGGQRHGLHDDARPQSGRRRPARRWSADRMAGTRAASSGSTRRVREG